MENNILKIKCYTRDSINNYLYFIEIYNSKSELIYKAFTEDGLLTYNISYPDIYKIVVKPLSNLYPQIICKILKLDLYHTYNINFVFYKYCYVSKRYITFNFTDKNYKNLLIEKGEIFLWPRLM